MRHIMETAAALHELKRRGMRVSDEPGLRHWEPSSYQEDHRTIDAIPPDLAKPIAHLTAAGGDGAILRIALIADRLAGRLGMTLRELLETKD